jgi:DNA-binding response OmpR family regulator
MVRGAGYDAISTWSGLEALDLLKSGKIHVLLVSSYLPDLYIGDFLARVRSLPIQPCSIVMQEGHDLVATLSRVTSIIGEEKFQEN